MVQGTKTKVLRLAADRLGGRRRLRDRLGVSSTELAAWIAGTADPPEEVFLKALGLLLDDLDARD